MLDYLLDNDFARYAALLLLFAAVAIVVVIGANLVEQRRGVRSRLETDKGVSAATATTGAARLRGEQQRGAWIDIVNQLEKRGVNLVSTTDQGLRRKLVAAGYEDPSAPRVFTLVRIISTLAFPLLLVAYSFVSGTQLGLASSYFMAVFAAGLGYVIPILVIQAKADRRKEELLNGFPDALDLMLVCVEAGLGLEVAFDRVGQEMFHSHPDLARHFAGVVLELRAGRSREDALRRFADRAGVDEIRAFSTLLIQSQKLGSSVAATLRVYAAEMREKRRMRAEERAHRLPVLLALPLVGCMLPVMIGVLMVPAVIRAMRTVVPALG
ncbi:type II secretion system F family protein [Sphingomicrobium astaxanthinifaciens]|uniref:type II secretion system F family protein n=1 Tax=Sphingomicrobium astaxanthinifaciens TaxID=1227949 RepID=UPI001FCAB9FF|nr:type II secretion system F family protein [Sphingomicrobium astaxanthinifaciens]MCJ7421289.1 type II secretion system F family protein [Sphingomicrobium astaxanthinifaciens]